MNGPDIELTSTVRAHDLSFGTEPHTEVRFHGSPGRQSISGSKRAGLPDQVEAGIRYPDVRVDYRLATRLRRPAARRAQGSNRTDSPGC